MLREHGRVSDEEVARRVQAGEIESFAILVERYENKIKRYARKFLSGFEDIEDLVQGVFLKAYVNIRSFDTSKKFSSWLYRIAHNEFINAIKKKGKEPVSFFDFDIFFPHPVSADNADNDLNREEIRRMIGDCLLKLKPKYREPIVLYFLEELSYKEIADVLHIPVSTVGVRLQRGKQIMRSICQKLTYY